MDNKVVIKRNGDKVLYDTRKIYAAIEGANKDSAHEMSESAIGNVVMRVNIDLQDKNNIGVEYIQDRVEEALMTGGYYKTAKQYILYRELHNRRRNAAVKLMEQYGDLFFTSAEGMDLKRDNANINADGSMGIMLKLGTEGAKAYVDNYFLPKEVAQADKEGWIHIHDKDFSLITLNCIQIDLAKLFKGGFCTGHGFLREPNSIRTAAAQACVAIQSNQNEMFGGQSINALDYALAPYVGKGFKKAMKKYIDVYSDATGLSFPQDDIDDILKKTYYCEKEEARFLYCFDTDKGCENKKLSETASKAWRRACQEVEEETKQAMEAMIHNFNTLHSRAGAQVPFSSINYGLDTSPEGRLVTRMTLEAIWDGMGHGETPIFPISVFQIKTGINYNPGDPNYDLFQRACEVSAKRLYPNFVNVDAPYNLQYYQEGNPNSAIATMG